MHTTFQNNHILPQHDTKQRSRQQQKDCIEKAFDGDVIAMAECYYDMVCRHVEKWNPTFVGHFDLITKSSLIPEEDKRSHLRKFL